VSRIFELIKLGVLLIKLAMQEFTVDLKHKMRGVWRDTKWWTRPTRTTTNWPLINLGLPSLFLEMSVCQLLYFGIFILICPNMLCAMSVDSACAYFESWGSSVA
jgi:hypothetical protein